MEINIISFGKVAEIIQNQQMNISGLRNTDDLKSHLNKIYPELSGMKYTFALNQNIVQQNTEIQENDTVAIMPPFSGG